MVAMLKSVLSSEERISLMVKQESSEDNNDTDQQQQEQRESPSLLEDDVNNDWNITGDSSNTVASQASTSFTEEFWRNMSQISLCEIAKK